MSIRFFLAVLFFLLSALGVARSADTHWSGPSLHPDTERLIEHIGADCDPMSIIPIILCPDEKYLPHAGVTATSLLENANKAYAYDIYLICDKRPTDAQKKTWFELGEQYADAVNFNVTFVDGSILIDTQELSGAVWGSTSLYRLVAPEMDIFAQYDKLIYIDCDMIVYDIIPFWTQPLEKEEGNQAWFVAVWDIMHQLPDLCQYAVNGLIQRMPSLGEDPQFVCEDYINSGLLLMNLKELRLHDFTTKALDFIRVHKPVWVDQDTINALAFKNLKRLEFKYAYPFMLTKTKPEGIFVMHYVDKPKPWSMRLPSDPELISSLSDYHFYRQKSPWKFIPVKKEASSSAPLDSLSALKKWRSAKSREERG